MHRTLAFDVAWVSHVKDGQSSTLVSFDIKKRSAIVRFVEEHLLFANIVGAEILQQPHQPLELVPARIRDGAILEISRLPEG